MSPRPKILDLVMSLRLMAALDGGQAAGGDSPGMQSAAMLIVKKDGGMGLQHPDVVRLAEGTLVTRQNQSARKALSGSNDAARRAGR